LTILQSRDYATANNSALRVSIFANAEHFCDHRW
jgi:hypothetical protein